VVVAADDDDRGCAVRPWRREGRPEGWLFGGGGGGGGGG
jgi:hypothetical protein